MFPVKSRIFFYFTLIVILSFSSSCKLGEKIDQLIHGASREVANVEMTLNGAMNEIAASAANWESILRETIDKIPEAEAVVKADLEELLNSSIGKVGTEFRCNVDFFGVRINEAIQRIKAKFLGQDFPDIIPRICNVSVAAVDMNLPVSTRNKIEIYGYNFQAPETKLFLKTNSGLHDVTSKMFRTSDYQYLINLGSNGVGLNEQSQALLLKYYSTTLITIPVIQSYPEICKTFEREEAVSSITIIPRKTAGDTEWGGHGPCVKATARIWITGDKRQIKIQVNILMHEANSDCSQRNDSKAFGSLTDVIYTAPSNHQIVEITSPNRSVLDYIYTGSSNHHVTRIHRSGLIKTWYILGDTPGRDIGESYVTAEFNNLKIILRETGDCITEDELQDLIDSQNISPRAIRKVFEAKPYLRRNLRIISPNSIPCP